MSSAQAPGTTNQEQMGLYAVTQTSAPPGGWPDTPRTHRTPSTPKNDMDVVGENGHPINAEYTHIPLPVPPSPMDSDEPDEQDEHDQFAAVVPVAHNLPCARQLFN